MHMARLKVGLGPKKAAEGYPASLTLVLYTLGTYLLQAVQLLLRALPGRFLTQYKKLLTFGWFPVRWRLLAEAVRHSLSLAGSSAAVNTLVR